MVKIKIPMIEVAKEKLQDLSNHKTVFQTGRDSD